MDAARAARNRRRRRAAALGALAVAGAAIGAVAWDKLFRRVVPSYASDEEHFKYGSIGNDGATGMPRAIWLVLPKAFPELLPGPGGYAAFGFRWEAGRGPAEAPIGFSRARVGVERMAINCAVCHVGSFRREPGGALEFALAGVSNPLDVLGYQRFLFASARDPRFTPEILLPMIAAEVELSWLDRLLYRWILIPATRKALLEQARAFAWTDSRPSWGPGRIDPFNPAKFGMLRLPDDGTIGNADMMAVWALDARERIRPGAPLHWDGLNNSIREVVVSSALGDGAVAREFDWASIERIERFLRRSAPPPSPHRPEPAAVERGRAVFAGEGSCAGCHDAGGSRTLTVVPVDQVGTDPNRLEMWSDASRDAYSGYREGYDWNFRAFRNVEGYVAVTLDGLWLRGPYLHNGSVPTLADLLEPPARRPTAFLRGGEDLDFRRGGFAAPACDPATPPPGRFCHDTSLPGNGNHGHLYGTELSPATKADLLAYLLTQ